MRTILKRLGAFFLVVWLLGVIGPAQASSPQISSNACSMSPDDRAWLLQALVDWRTSERIILKIPRRPLPTIVVADARCTYTLASGADPDSRWTGLPHGDHVTLPDGKTAPVGAIAFASVGAHAGDQGYFVMTLPSVWRAAGVTSGLGLTRLMDGVMLHELMHSRQFYFADPRLTALAAHHRPAAEISDDSLQERFGKVPGYAAAYRSERDTLFAAASAPTRAEARLLAAKALAQLRARRARWFVGSDASWAEYDDIFLDMEGIGQWLAYSWYRSAPGCRISPATALREVRRGGKYWTQDEGLALFLVVDRLVPDWQRQAFAPKPHLAEMLLSAAAQARPEGYRSKLR